MSLSTAKISGSYSNSLDRIVHSNHPILMRILMESLLEDNLPDSPSFSPLYRAVREGLTDAVRTLVQLGVDTNERNELGEIPLHIAVRKNLSEIVEILAPVSNVNTQSFTGMSPLHWACLLGYANIAEILLAYGADPWLHAKQVDDLTPRDLALIMDYPHILDLLENPLTLQ
ncbi:MAG: ankyrin repeat domain-containing protein [Candidatus Hydrogenedentes bacterium]|nr:ankyrin repeat domain-containing protein [Candidatus Hydrogenedentota bacterium]